VNPIQIALKEHQTRNTFRRLSRSDDRIDFASNVYLGFAKSDEIRGILIHELEKGCPLGATGSRLLSGNTSYHERVENYLAEKFRAPSALLFSSGFSANLAVMTALGSVDAEFYSDELNHASLIDGLRLTRSRRFVYQHGDVDQLEQLLSASASRFKVIVTESVFSMDGDLAPLEELLRLARKHQAWLVIDEAHATGVFGSTGLGRLEDLPTSDVSLVTLHTAGKALGGQGAFVLSDPDFRELMINRSRSFIYSTALAPLSALQIEAAVRLLNGNLTRDLLKNAALFDSPSPIVPIVLGSNERVLKAQEALQGAGFDVRAIRSPSVAVGGERLRITLKSFHRREEIEALKRELEKWR
jgi:8-amino-7-oxononanoate synthase